MELAPYLAILLKEATTFTNALESSFSLPDDLIVLEEAEKIQDVCWICCGATEKDDSENLGFHICQGRHPRYDKTMPSVRNAACEGVQHPQSASNP